MAQNQKAVPPPTPPLSLSEVGGRARLTLRGLTHGEGETLQEAADDLARRVLVIAMSYGASGIGAISSECHVDVAVVDFVFELGEIAARGDDIRPRLFGGGHGS